MITDSAIADAAEEAFPSPVQKSGRAPISQEERDKAADLQDAFERGAEWALKTAFEEQEYTEWKATWRPEWVERRGEPVQSDPGATGLSREDALHNLITQTQGGDFPGLRFWTRTVRKPEYGNWTEVS